MLYPAQPDPPEWTAGDDAINAIDDDRNNADVNDMRDNSAQRMDQHDIARLFIWMSVGLAVEYVLFTVWCSLINLTRQDLLLFDN